MAQSSASSPTRTPLPEPTPPHRAISPYLLQTSSPEDEIQSESITSQHEIQTLNLGEYALHVASTAASIRGVNQRFYRNPLVRACFEDESPTINPLLRSPTFAEEAPPIFHNTETTPHNDEMVSTRQGTSTKGSAKGSTSSRKRPPPPGDTTPTHPPRKRATMVPAQATQAQDSDDDLSAPAQPKPPPPDLTAFQYRFTTPVQQAASVQQVAPVQQAAPVERAIPAQQPAPTQQAATIQQPASSQNATPVQQGVPVSTTLPPTPGDTERPYSFIRFLPDKFKIVVDFKTTDYIGDTPDAMPRFTEPAIPPVKVGMTTNFGVIHEGKDTTIAFGFEPASLRITLANKMYDITDVRGGALREEHVRFDKEYATERQRMKCALDMYIQLQIEWEEALSDYRSDMAKWRIARRKWEYDIAYSNWKQGRTSIFPGPLTDEDFHNLDHWLQDEIVKDGPETSPWNIGLIHPDHPTAITYTQKFRSGPAKDIAPKKMAAIDAAIRKLRAKVYPEVVKPTVLPPQIDYDDDSDNEDDFQHVDLENYIAWCIERHVAWRSIKIKPTDDAYAKFNVLPATQAKLPSSTWPKGMHSLLNETAVDTAERPFGAPANRLMEAIQKAGKPKDTCYMARTFTQQVERWFKTLQDTAFSDKPITAWPLPQSLATELTQLLS
ncbi:hypothetical protein IFM53868_10923 [Aspergillus udagawae]|uniref:Uncharacterized protein n=1 Tax=Aspergillus udagawae TaxID=91492 RepID=A0ABQ1BFC6_9EURO|nr:hypothetical protein IFM53868_10923 [Aspergillus udagawae]